MFDRIELLETLVICLIDAEEFFNLENDFRIRVESSRVFQE